MPSADSHPATARLPSVESRESPSSIRPRGPTSQPPTAVAHALALAVNSKLGFRIAPAPPRLPDALVERFRGIAAANVADAMGRFNFMDPGILSRTGLPSADAR